MHKEISVTSKMSDFMVSPYIIYRGPTLELLKEYEGSSKRAKTTVKEIGHVYEQTENLF